MRRDMQWKTRRDDGTWYEVRVRSFGGVFKFQFREQSLEQWDFQRIPERADLEELLAVLQRKYQRRQASDRDLKTVEKMIQAMD